MAQRTEQARQYHWEKKHQKPSKSSTSLSLITMALVLKLHFPSSALDQTTLMIPETKTINKKKFNSNNQSQRQRQQPLSHESPTLSSPFISSFIFLSMFQGLFTWTPVKLRLGFCHFHGAQVGQTRVLKILYVKLGILYRSSLLVCVLPFFFFFFNSFMLRLGHWTVVLCGFFTKVFYFSSATDSSKLYKGGNTPFNISYGPFE